MIEFFVAGTPKPAGSKRAFVIPNTNRAVLTDASGKPGKDWRGDVRAKAEEAMGDEMPLGCPVGVVLTFYMPRPKGHYGSGKNADKLKGPDRAPRWNTSAPDVDKLSRAILDALKGVCWTDDAVIAHKLASKPYADRHLGQRAGVRVQFEPLPLAAAVTSPETEPPSAEVLQAELDAQLVLS